MKKIKSVAKSHCIVELYQSGDAYILVIEDGDKTAVSSKINDLNTALAAFTATLDQLEGH